MDYKNFRDYLIPIDDTCHGFREWFMRYSPNVPFVDEMSKPSDIQEYEIFINERMDEFLKKVYDMWVDSKIKPKYFYFNHKGIISDYTINDALYVGMIEIDKSLIRENNLEEILK